jgi:hypothetical protein
MSKEYINCELAMTPGCPHQTNEFMLNLLASASKPTKILTDEMINNANSLCANCEDFAPRG